MKRNMPKNRQKRKNVFFLLITLFLLIAISITVFYIQKQQRFESQAAAAGFRQYEQTKMNMSANLRQRLGEGLAQSASQVPSPAALPAASYVGGCNQQCNESNPTLPYTQCPSGYRCTSYRPQGAGLSAGVSVCRNENCTGELDCDCTVLTPNQQNCARCGAASSVSSGVRVLWYDPDGKCDSDFDSQRLEVPDNRCWGMCSTQPGEVGSYVVVEAENYRGNIAIDAVKDPSKRMVYPNDPRCTSVMQPENVTVSCGGFKTEGGRQGYFTNAIIEPDPWEIERVLSGQSTLRIRPERQTIYTSFFADRPTTSVPWDMMRVRIRANDHNVPFYPWRPEWNAEVKETYAGPLIVTDKADSLYLGAVSGSFGIGIFTIERELQAEVHIKGYGDNGWCPNGFTEPPITRPGDVGAVLPSWCKPMNCTAKYTIVGTKGSRD